MQIGHVIDEMLWELPFQLTPLPELVQHASCKTVGLLDRILSAFSEQLNRQVLPDVRSCMESAIRDHPIPYLSVRRVLSLLGDSLGRFDLDGQLKGLSSVREKCVQEYKTLHDEHTSRIQSYRVLSICAGTALVILLL